MNDVGKTGFIKSQGKAGLNDPQMPNIPKAK